MSEVAQIESCARDGCGHPIREHVHDRVMHAGSWRDVARCLICERDGGPCTDSHSIVESVD
jgi:hypothetical protein